MFNFWKKKEPAVILSEIDLMIGRLKAISANSFSLAHSSDMSIFTITPLFHRIEIYTLKLKTALSALESKRTISILNYSGDAKEIWLSDFFLDNQSMHIDTVAAGNEFLQSAISYLTLYQQYESGGYLDIITRNIQILQQVTINLLLISDQLSNLFGNMDTVES